MNLKQNKRWFLLVVAVPLVLLSAIFAGNFFKSNPSGNTKVSIEGSPATPMVLGATSPLRGEADSVENQNWFKKGELDATGITAKSFLAYDLENGSVLEQKAPLAKLPIASLTKLMTALVVYENLDFSQSLMVSSQDQIKIQPILGLKPGDQVKIQDLFNAMLVGSCNDAAKTLSNYTAKITGKNFVSLMNERAKNLGMVNSHFSNPLGFDSQYNYSTVSDLKLLVDYTQNLAAFVNLGKMPGYSFASASGNIYKTTATNKLLSEHADIEAVKTGFTENAGGSIISKLTLEGRKVIIIVVGSKDREADTLSLKRQIALHFVLQ